MLVDVAVDGGHTLGGCDQIEAVALRRLQQEPEHSLIDIDDARELLVDHLVVGFDHPGKVAHQQSLVV